ncbi:MAG: hypothetical protein R2762_28525 [Bryobacteraceae bacterium]
MNAPIVAAGVAAGAAMLALMSCPAPVVDTGKVLPDGRLPQWIEPPAKAVFTELCGRPEPHPAPEQSKEVQLASFDDIPISGGDGSFRLNMGMYTCPLTDGSYATHTHESCHVFWIVRPDPNDSTKSKLLRQAVKLPPGSLVKIDLEQKPAGNAPWIAAGNVLIEHGTALNYGKSCAWKGSDGGHKTQGTLNDLVWRVSATGVLLSPDQAWNQVNGMFQYQPVNLRNIKWWSIESVRMKKVEVLPKGGAPETFDLSNGCSQFQICGADSGFKCEAVPMPCFPDSGEYTVSGP